MKRVRALRAAAGIATALAVLTPVTSVAEPHSPALVHTIVPGDTLGALAKRYGVTVVALVAANRLPSERAKLRLGQQLTIPEPGAAVPPGAWARAAAATRAPTPPRPPADLVLAVPEFVEEVPLFAWPLEGPVISLFGLRRRSWHRGIDIKALPGSPVISAAPGVVITSGVEGRYGRLVRVEHDQGFVTVYAHNEDNLVTVGDRVSAGDKIATVGRTGRATTSHVHFEIRHLGRVVNPLYLLPQPPSVQVDETMEEEPE
ncbi:MAG: peptidoglycan DD-metalloendopeptidase family protein [Candidatus Rokuibacteriota bacterium]